MGLGKLFASLSSPSSSASRPRENYRPPLSPASSKPDHPYDMKPSSPSSSKQPPKSYYPGDDGDDIAPPAYRPGKGPDLSDYGTDFKASQKIQPDAAYPPPPTRIRGPTNPRGEDPLLSLKNYDIDIIFDDSYSMRTVDNPGGLSRWTQAWSALNTLVHVGAKYDKNGIDIHFLNNERLSRTVKTTSDLEKLRRSVPEPESGTHTPTGDVLESLLLRYRKQLAAANHSIRVKKRIFLVITDGAATDSPEEGIINAANFLQENFYPADQVGIQFIQVGNDHEAGEFLDELDRGLVGRMGQHYRDMVDTIKSNGEDLAGDALVKALTGGFNRRQDRAGE